MRKALRALTAALVILAMICGTPYLAVAAVGETEYAVTFDYTGSYVAPEVEYQVNSGAVERVTAGTTVWVPAGSDISYSYQSYVYDSNEVDDDTRWAWYDSEPGSITGIDQNTTVMGYYEPEYKVWFVSDPEVNALFDFDLPSYYSYLETPDYVWVPDDEDVLFEFAPEVMFEGIKYLFVKARVGLAVVTSSYRVTGPATITAYYSPADTSLWAFGANWSGQLGDGTDAGKPVPTQIGESLDWKAVAAGVSHTFGLKTNGTLWSWGANFLGQLGDGTSVDKLTPTQIGTHDWVAISSGPYHGMAIKSDGSLWGWGYNYYGQLGDGTTVNRLVPTRVGDDNDWQTVSASQSHTLALKTDGTLWAWGDNELGQLGNGTTSTTPTLTPQPVGSDRWKVVSAGKSYSLGIKEEGSLWAWGHNNSGQLGTGNVAPQHLPFRLGTEVWLDVATGDEFSLAIKSDGTLWGWGDNQAGQLGIGSGYGYDDQANPIQAGTDTNWAKLGTILMYHCAALKSDGSLYAWGLNEHGQLGLNDPVNRDVPTQVGAGKHWLAVSCGAGHTVAIAAPTYTVAYNGNGGTGDPPAPSTSYASGATVTVLANTFTKDGHTFVKWNTEADGSGTDYDPGGEFDIDESDVTLYAIWEADSTVTASLLVFGSNSSGQLGDGTYTAQHTPWLLADDPGNPWLAVSAGFDHTLALKADGTLWAWGDNGTGELGNGTDTSSLSPAQVKIHGNGYSWLAISAGYNYSTAIRSDGTLWAWGRNFYGQLGVGGEVDKLIPTQVGTAVDWSAVYAGFYHTLALKADGTLWAWGYNEGGQLGDGTTSNTSTPKQVGEATDWKVVSAGKNHSLGIREDGSLWAWGYNNAGQLGTGYLANISSPFSISSAVWLDIAAGDEFSVAIKSDGTLWGWGYNSLGQLGLGSTDSYKDVPTQAGTDKDWAKLDASSYHCAALKSDGSLYTWGWNGYGQLGNGTTTTARTPTEVGGDWSWLSISCGGYHTAGIATPATAPTTHTVTFGVVGSNGTLVATVDSAELISPAHVEAGKTVIFTATPASGYKVDGWSYDWTMPGWDDSGWPLVLTYIGLDRDLTVQVDFESAFYVTYDANGADSGTVPLDTNPYAEGGEVIVLGNTGDLVKSGYTFGGWSYGGITYTAGDKLAMPATDVIFSAVWNATTPTTYTVTFATNPTYVNALVTWEYGTGDGESGELYTGVAPSITVPAGCTLNYRYWSPVTTDGTEYRATGDSPWQGSITVNATQTVTWDYSTFYKVSLTATDGTDPISAGFSYSIGDGGSLVNFTPYDLWVPAGASLSYTYYDVAWAHEYDSRYKLQSSGPDLTAGVTEPTIVAGVYRLENLVEFRTEPVIAASFTWTATSPSSATLSGAGTADTSAKDVWVPQGWSLSFDFAQTVVRAEKTYVYVNATETSGDTPTGPGTIWGNYALTYTVTYNGNNSTGGSVPVDSNRYKQGDQAMVLGNVGGDPPGSDPLTRTGYTFLGWSTDSTATEAEYVAGGTYSIAGSDVVLYAIWEEVTAPTTHTVTFATNPTGVSADVTWSYGTEPGESGTANTASDASITVPAGAELTFAFALTVVDGDTKYEHTGASHTPPVTVNAGMTVTGNYDTYHKVTFATVPTEVGAAITTSHGNVNTGSDTPWIWVAKNATLTYTFPALVNNGDIYTLNSAYPVSGMTVTAPVTVTGYYCWYDQIFKGKGIGFWGSPAGQRLLQSKITPAELVALLNSYNLWNENGTKATFTESSKVYKDFGSWVSKPTSKNMSYMLSAHLASMVLMVEFGEVQGTDMVFAPSLAGDVTLNDFGFISVEDLVTYANVLLGETGNNIVGTKHPQRAKLERVRSILDGANNNKILFAAPVCPEYTSAPLWDVTGPWWLSTGDVGPDSVALALIQAADGTLTGAASRDGSSLPVVEGRVSGNRIEFALEYEVEGIIREVWSGTIESIAAYGLTMQQLRCNVKSYVDGVYVPSDDEDVELVGLALDLLAEPLWNVAGDWYQVDDEDGSLSDTRGLQLTQDAEGTLGGFTYPDDLNPHPIEGRTCGEQIKFTTAEFDYAGTLYRLCVVGIVNDTGNRMYLIYVVFQDGKYYGAFFSQVGSR